MKALPMAPVISSLVLLFASRPAEAAVICDICPSGDAGDCCDDFGCGCDAGLVCLLHRCSEPPNCPAAADCRGATCGLDPICGESCGECKEGQTCDTGACATACDADHPCAESEVCSGLEGVCVDRTIYCGYVGIAPLCFDRGLWCGIDPICGRECGTCPVQWECVGGTCIEPAPEAEPEPAPEPGPEAVPEPEPEAQPQPEPQAEAEEAATPRAEPDKTGGGGCAASHVPLACLGLPALGFARRRLRRG